MHNGRFDIQVIAEYQKTRCIDPKFHINASDRSVCIFSGEQDFDVICEDEQTFQMLLSMFWLFGNQFHHDQNVRNTLYQFIEQRR